METTWVVAVAASSSPTTVTGSLPTVRSWCSTYRRRSCRALAATQAGPQGVTFSSTQIGTWEATGPRGTHLTVVQLLSDHAGAYVGSVTADAFQEVSEDGQTWTSGEWAVTIHDAADTIVVVITGGPPATGVRKRPGVSSLPGGRPPTRQGATPTTARPTRS